MSESQIKLVITGRMGAGKSTAARHFKEAGATVWARTQLMKRLAHAVGPDQIGDPEAILARLFDDEKQRAQVGRELLRYIATYQPEPGRRPLRLYQQVTAICQQRDPLVFERELWARITDAEKAGGPSSFILIDDVRSPDALVFFAKRGFRSLRIEASEYHRHRRLAAKEGLVPAVDVLNHPSETLMDEVAHDFTVVNNGTICEFTAALDQVLAHLRGDG